MTVREKTLQWPGKYTDGQHKCTELSVADRPESRERGHLRSLGQTSLAEE